MPKPLHPLVTRQLPAARTRRDVALRDHDLQDELHRIDKAWPTQPLPHRVGGPVGRIGMLREFDATVAFGADDVAGFAAAFRHAMALRSLALRWQVFLAPHSAENFNMPNSAWDTVKLAGPAILGQWAEAGQCARALLAAAHFQQAHCAPEVYASHWGKGTVDALLVLLLAQAFGLPTHYQAAQPLAPAYQALLAHWRTSDEALYRQTLQAAAQFHIACCGDSTDELRYEFDAFFAQIFPLELLVVQALRQRDGLPAFDTGHALVDAPWALLRHLPPAPPEPLVARIDQRLRQDYPAWAAA